jgi:hypothetical protein
MPSFETIFGNSCTVVKQPADYERQYNSFPGSDGLVSIYMGKRGSAIVITGFVEGAGTGYNGARANANSKIENLESWCSSLPANYTYRGQTFYDVVFEKLQLIPDPRSGIVYNYIKRNGNIKVNFIMYARSLS